MQFPGRQSIRLKGYDYSQSGGYFVTVVTQLREPLFGDIRNGEMILNDAGKMVQECWENLPNRFSSINIDVFQIMPNHFHGIIIMHDVGATLVVAQNQQTITQPQRAGTRPAPTLADIIGAFKSITTLAYIRGVDKLGWPQFDKRLWQRNYYEHIIRNQRDYERVASYIAENPTNWLDDEENLIQVQSYPCRRDRFS